jgi:uncharacterized protein YegJ (DUF2314 family)
MFEFFKKKKSVEKIEDKTANLSEDDISLKAFKERAQEGLQYLIDFMEAHEKDDELFKYAVKADFIEDGKSEHMWVQVNEFKDGQFLGKLANTPNTIKALKYGDRVDVKREDVEDWILRDDLTNTKVGGFSSEYIRSKTKQT